MIPVPEEFAIVRRILDLARAGKSSHAIAAKLNQEGVPSKHGARWHHSTIGKVVRAALCP